MSSYPEIPLDLLQLSTMTLATTDREGRVHTAAVFFVATSSLKFYFFSEKHTQHSQDVHVNPQAAVSIYPECYDWREIRGVQMHGEVFQVEQGSEWEAAWVKYRRKFPFVNSLKTIVGQNTFYVFKPGWIRLVDNRCGFGYKKEWTIFG